ncbi:MAG: terminase small subunit [Oscillospiraceae bacterium]|nr:terminase small subunit [Oscillospiraceae bacterium]
MALTAKQESFVAEYLIDCNATQAAIRAGYSVKTANEQASRLLANVNIQEYMKKLMSEKDNDLIASQDEVLQTLTRILRREEKEFIVITVKERKTFYDDSGKKRIEDKETPQLVEIPTKIYDVNKAAELLAKRYGLLTDKVQMGGAIPVVISGSEKLED